MWWFLFRQQCHLRLDATTYFGNLFNDVSKVNQGSCKKEFSTYKLNFLHCYRYFSHWLSWASLYFLWMVCGVYNARFLCWPCQRHSLAVSCISPPSIVTSDQPSTFYLISHDSWKFLILLIYLFIFYITFFPALLVPSSLPTQCGFYFLTFEIIKKLKRYLTIGRISWKATLHKLESVHVCFCVCLHFRQYSRWIQFCETFLGQELSSWSVREDWDRAQYHVINGSISKL